MSIEWNITRRKGILKGYTSDERISELKIPDGVKKIGDDAFQHCDELERVIFPDSVEEIGAWAFQGCKQLKYLHLPEHVSEIGACAFRNCKQLKDFHVPEHTKIGGLAFLDTAWAENQKGDFIILNHTLLKYQGSAAHLQIPEMIYDIADNAAAQNQHIQYLTVPESVTRIECGAFRKCENLKSVQLPQSLCFIGYEAFLFCPLERVPLLVEDGHIFHRFPEMHTGLYRASYFVRNSDYEIELISGTKHDLIFQKYMFGMDETGTAAYIQTYFPEMIPVLIRLNDIALMQKLCRYLPDLIIHHIDALIQEAILQKKLQIQLMLTDYKYQHCDFKEKDWNL